MLTAKDYHFETSYDRSKLSGQPLDWANQPQVFKAYPGLEAIVLPAEVSFPQLRFSEVLRGDETERFVGSLDRLTSVLLLAETLTGRSRQAGGTFYYRSVPSAGALYPCELYLGIEAISGCEDGLYHYTLQHRALTRLRSGRPSTEVCDLVSRPAPDSRPGITFFITVIFFRSAWKYRDRAYRYHLLDTGHLLEGLLLALKVHGIPWALSLDFYDKGVNTFLGLDDRREGCLALVQVPNQADHPHNLAEPLTPLTPLPAQAESACRMARTERVYPLIEQMHEASGCLLQETAAVCSMADRLGVTPQGWSSLPEAEGQAEKLNFSEAVLQRRSKRNFIGKRLPLGDWGFLLRALCGERAPIATEEGTVCTGLLCESALEGLAAGFYLLDTTLSSVGLVRPGSFIPAMAHACLDQLWLGNAALHVFFLANLQVLEERWGPRGYRYAMTAAGRLGHRLYVGATAQGLGACGVGAFYDAEAAHLLGLNEDTGMLYLVAIGPVKK
jgi:SagB-type dehydrogenase family enzyme